MLQLNQLAIDGALSNLRTVDRDSLLNGLTILDNLLTPQCKISVSGSVITIGASEVQTVTSNGAYATTNAEKIGIGPVSNQYASIAASTLDVSDGSVSGDFVASPVGIAMTTSNYIAGALELRSDKKWYINWGTEQAVKANTLLTANTPSFTSASIIKRAVVILQKSGAGTWNFANPALTDIIVLPVGGAGGSGSGSYLNFDTAGDASNALIGDYTTGNSAIFGASGTLDGTFVIDDTAANLIYGDKVFLYTCGSSSANDWISRLVDIPLGFRGRELRVRREYKTDFNDSEVNFVVYDVDNTTVLLTYPVSKFSNADNTATALETTFYCPSDCTQIKYGFQIATGNSGKKISFDLCAADPFVPEVKGTQTATKVVTTASSGTWVSGVAGTPDIWVWFWDDSTSTWDLWDAPSRGISSDGSGAISYDFTSDTFNTNDYVVIIAKGGTVVATPSNEYDSGWITVSGVNDLYKGALTTGSHEVTLPGGFTDHPAGITVLYDDGTDVSAADYASVFASYKSSGVIKASVDTVGWNSTDKFRLYCSQNARPVGSQTYVVQDFTTIGSVGSVGQTMAGHQIEVTEPGTSSTETLALYHFGASGGAITADEKGTYDLTNVGSTPPGGGIFGGSTGAAAMDGTAKYFTNGTLLDDFGSSVAIDCWFKVNTAAAEFLFSKQTISTHGLFADRRSDKRLRVGTGVGSWVESYSTTLLEQDTWYYITINWDTTNGLRLWINGVLDLTDGTKTTLPTTGTTTDFFIGEYFAGGYYCDGSIAYFRVRNKILTQKDVDIAYATTYPWDSTLPLADATITPFTQEDGNSDFTAQYAGDFEVARFNNTIYRYAAGTEAFPLGPSDKLKIVGRVQ